MEKQKCVNCGKTFIVTDSEIAFFESKNLHLPKRCEECRKENREIRGRTRKSIFIRMFEKFQTKEHNLEKIQNKFTYSFKNTEDFKAHFIKHGRECNCKTPKKYLKTANKIIKSKKSLKKKEKEDGDTVYFSKKNNGIVFVSRKGYIRSFYISEISYFKRQ